MPPSPVQTPLFFLNASAKETLDNAKCRNALAACGYVPEDFGSYKEIDARLKAARVAARSRGTKAQQGSAQKGIDPRGHLRWIGTKESQSGHLSENSRHQTKRGKNETSHCDLYDFANAPCMPHMGNGFDPKTQHGAVFVQDRESAKEATAALGPSAEMGVKRETKATNNAIKASLDYGMKDGQKISPKLRDKRFAAIAALNAKDKDIKAAAASGDKAKLKQAVKDKYDANKDTAQKCIEAFFKAQWAKMADDTKEAKAKALADAKGETAAAQAKLDALKGKKGDKADADRAKARKELAAAKENEAAAKEDNDAVKDKDPQECLGESQTPAPRKKKPSGGSSSPSRRKTTE